MQLTHSPWCMGFFKPFAPFQKHQSSLTQIRIFPFEPFSLAQALCFFKCFSSSSWFANLTWFENSGLLSWMTRFIVTSFCMHHVIDASGEQSNFITIHLLPANLANPHFSNILRHLDSSAMSESVISNPISRHHPRSAFHRSLKCWDLVLGVALAMGVQSLTILISLEVDSSPKGSATPLN